MSPAIFLPCSLSQFEKKNKKAPENVLKCSLSVSAIKGLFYFGKRERALSQNVLLPGVLS